ncbi:MAG: hypothetical protein FWG18_00395 [Alphaproteobacteria bacterium]|nr:hypothetical protein [Alphaproteobacteria bacterium]
MLEQRGSNLLETLLAIGLVAAMTPFVYNRIAETSREINDVTTAREISSWADKISGYVRKNQADWPAYAEIDLDRAEMFIIAGLDPKKTTNAKASIPYAAFIDKYRHRGGTTIDSYLLFNNMPGIRTAKVARNLGNNSAIVDDFGTAFSPTGNWSVESETFQPGDLIYRVSITISNDDSEFYLHRMHLDDNRLNTMERDLWMSRHSIKDIDIAAAATLDSKMVGTWFTDALAFSAELADFPGGANIDPSESTFSSIRATQDVAGFRTIESKILTGTGGTANWSTNGSIIADRASVTDALHVGRNLTLRSSYARTVTGFAGVTAYSVSVPFISAIELRFSEGYGMTISSELLSGYGSGPLKLGNWNFPSNSPPRFTNLNLRKTGNIAQGANIVSAEFDKIIKSGWKSVRTKSQGAPSE